VKHGTTASWRCKNNFRHPAPGAAGKFVTGPPIWRRALLSYLATRCSAPGANLAAGPPDGSVSRFTLGASCRWCGESLSFALAASDPTGRIGRRLGGSFQGIVLLCGGWQLTGDGSEGWEVFEAFPHRWPMATDAVSPIFDAAMALAQ